MSEIKCFSYIYFVFSQKLGKAPAQLVGPGSDLDWLRPSLTEGRGLLVYLPRPMADLGAYWLLISTTDVFPMVCILEFL